MGAGILAPLVAPALALGAAGPLGWVAVVGAAMSSIVIVAGDEEMRKRCCWEDVLRIDETNSTPKEADSAFNETNSAPMPRSKIDFHRQNGMLLSDLASHCEVLKTKEEGDEPEKLILKNQHGE